MTTWQVLVATERATPLRVVAVTRATPPRVLARASTATVSVHGTRFALDVPDPWLTSDCNIEVFLSAPEHSQNALQLGVIIIADGADRSDVREWVGVPEQSPVSVITVMPASTDAEGVPSDRASFVLGHAQERASPLYRAGATPRRSVVPEGVVVPVFFGTNRMPFMRSAGGVAGFDERSPTNELQLGQADVYLPPSRRRGSVGSRWPWRVVRLTDDRVTVHDLECLDAPVFADRVRARATHPGHPPAVLVFIHGYNVGFAEALCRAAQVAHDVNFPGAVACFSWPSQGNPASYLVDGNLATASEAPLSLFLACVGHATPEARVSLLSHSMGNRTTLGALRSLRLRVPDAPRYAHLICAAPDVDQRKFFDDCDEVAPLCDAITLYASSGDTALAVARSIVGYPRAGHLPPVTIGARFETVVCQAVDADFLGHSYFASAEPLLLDLHALLVQRVSAAADRGLPEAGEPGANYWRIA